MDKAIYKITNKLNGKVYIGQTIHPKKRFQEHCSSKDNLPIHLAIQKYGKENFSFEVLEWTADYDAREKEFISFYQSLVPHGYNILDGSSSNPVMRGENHPRNSIADAVVEQIIQELLSSEKSDRQLAKEYCTTDKIISDINHGRTHWQSGLNYPLRIRRGRTGGLKEEIRKAIIKDLQETSLSYSQLANKYNITKGMIGHINCGRYNKIPGINYPIRGSNNVER